MDDQFPHVRRTTDAMDPNLRRQSICPSQDFQFVLPMVLGDEKPSVIRSSLSAADCANVAAKAVHATPRLTPSPVAGLINSLGRREFTDFFANACSMYGEAAAP